MMASYNLPVSLVPLTEQTLQRLASQFTVRDIMVPAKDLVKAKTVAEACNHLEIYDDFNLIPIETEDRITSYVERGDPQLKSIVLDVVIGNGCSILDLVDVLADRRFCFISGKVGIEGYVHFSDLNHNLVDLPFYILLQAMETRVISLIQDLFNEANLHEVFDKVNTNIVKNIMNHFNKNKATDSNRSLLNEVNLDKMLEFACYFKLLELSGDEIDELSSVRNSLAHVPERLIQSHDDVKRLKRTKAQCYKILSSYLSASNSSLVR